jgi:hypothetical protein
MRVKAVIEALKEFPEDAQVVVVVRDEEEGNSFGRCVRVVKIEESAVVVGE